MGEAKKNDPAMRRTGGSGFFQALMLAFLLASASLQLHAQPCTQDDLLKKTGGWKQYPDYLRPGKNFTTDMQPEIFSRMEKIRQILYKAYTPKGMEVGWERQIYGTPQARSATVTYGLWGQLLEYECDAIHNKIVLAEESDDHFFALVNHFDQFLYYDTSIRVGHYYVALMANRVGSLQGTDLFQTSLVRNDERFVIISREGMRPYTPLTQKQYLVALKEKFQREEKYQIDRDLAFAKDEARRQASRQYWESHIEPKIKAIDDYLSHAQESDLNQAAFVRDMQDFKRFYTEKEGGRMPVIVNADYFKPGLKPYFPQFIMIVWQWNDGEGPGGGILRPVPPDMNTCCRVAKHFKDSMEGALDLKALQLLLDN